MATCAALRRSVVPVTRALTAVLLGVMVCLAAAGDPAAAEGLGGSNVLVVDGVDDYASAPDGPAFDLGQGATDDFTLETRFKVPAETGQVISDVFQKPWAYFVQFIFNVNLSALDRLTFRVQIDHSTVADLQYQTVLAPGWHHLAVTFDNETGTGSDAIAMYLDGVRVAGPTAGAWDPGVPDSRFGFSLGGYQGADSFPGKFEETRVSDSVRYTGPTYTVPTEPFTTDAHTTALWHFDEAVGATSFADASGNGNTLTGNNGATTGVDDMTPPLPPMLDQPPSPTHDKQVALSGMTEPGSVVEVFEGATQIATATTYDDGGFAAQPTLAPGTHQLTATATDAAGNVSEVSSAVTVVVDTGRPAAKAINTVRVKKGRKASLEFRVDDPAPSCGRATVTIRIKHRVTTVKVITIPNVATNQLRIARLKVTLPRGQYTWTVRATDDAGNTGKVSAARSFVVT